VSKMIRREINEEAGARSDGLMFVSVIFIATFTYIAFTTNPVYTGIGVGDRAPEITGQVWNGNTWETFDLHSFTDPSWEEGDDDGTWFMVEFMDTNCGACQKSAPDIAAQQSKWLDGGSRSMPTNTTVQFLAVAFSLNPGADGWDYSREEITNFRENYEHTFGYMDDLDNSNRDVWGIDYTPQYYLIAPNGIIQFASPEASAGENVWDSMEINIPRGD